MPHTPAKQLLRQRQARTGETWVQVRQAAADLIATGPGTTGPGTTGPGLLPDATGSAQRDAEAALLRALAVDPALLTSVRSVVPRQDGLDLCVADAVAFSSAAGGVLRKVHSDAKTLVLQGAAGSRIRVRDCSAEIWQIASAASAGEPAAPGSADRVRLESRLLRRINLFKPAEHAAWLVAFVAGRELPMPTELREQLSAEPPFGLPPGEAPDAELAAVRAALLAKDPDGARISVAVRQALDAVVDGPATGRVLLSEVTKYERVALSAKAEAYLGHALGLADGEALDFRIAGAEVDFLATAQRGFMISPEATGGLVLLLSIDVTAWNWSLGLVRAGEEALGAGHNRDNKRQLRRGAAVTWLFEHAALPPNALVAMSDEDRAAVLALSGQRAVNELFRRGRGLLVDRYVLETVCRQGDAAKRVREARRSLRVEGIEIRTIGDEAPERSGPRRVPPRGFVSVGMTTGQAGRRSP